ncbi:MAG TPA: serine/threonine protein kinase [Bacillota bacterium]|nr:serine/threonine protein kinase [Bacillota bacterium]
MTTSKSAGSHAAHLGSVTPSTQGLLQRQLWLWPLMAAALLAFVGLWVRPKMEGAMRAQITTHLETVRDANTEALRAWAGTMTTQAQLLAEDNRVRERVGRLLRSAEAQGVSPTARFSAPELDALRAQLQPVVQGHGFAGYAVLDTNLVVIASERDPLLGVKSPPGYAEHLQRCLAGEAIVTQPFTSLALLPDAAGNLRAGVPTMFAAAPIHSAGGEAVAVLALRIVPERDFTRILATARSGRSGETYAFNRRGALLSESRFDEELKRMGLIPDSPEARSILTLELRDPLVDLGQGRQSPKRRTELPFTKAVSEALAGRTGVDARGYRDYRGLPVVGAWTWLPEFELGLATEMDMAEAFAPAGVMRLGFWFLFGLLGAGSAAVFVLMQLAGRWQERAHQAAQEARQLGQYALDDEIGSGGFGTVFRGHHALMRRPVAVKVLDPTADDRTIARFEREVQLTCQLTHPNTIALYDYGRTPDGLFYYAMEYLEGFSLGRLIKECGPQPEGRVIHILRQVCASLAEAHAQSLVHRDIKPENIFLTFRGGIPDFVKVLDFGLVKAPTQTGELELTRAHATLGTPLYMSPEAFQRPDLVDARSDLYSLGCVGYELLTGQTVFCGLTFGEVLLQQVRAQPEPPSARLNQPVSPDLENLILRCLAKSPKARPASATALGEALAACAAAGTWSRQAAAEWWAKHSAAPNQQLSVPLRDAPGLKPALWERF